MLACVTPVAGLTEPVVVEPLANLPVVSDLVVDMGRRLAGLLRPRNEEAEVAR